jgi:WD40 repeat protein
VVVLIVVLVLAVVTDAFWAEVAGLGLAAPVAVGRLGGRDGTVGAVAPTRSARVSRGLFLAVVGVCLAVGVGTIAVTLPRYGGAVTSAGATAGLTLLAGFLAAYTVLGLAVTSRTAANSVATLRAGAGFGAAAGVAWCALMPFNQTLSVARPWLAAGYWLALALVVVGAPAGAAAVTSRRSGSAQQAVVAAACTGGFGALVILAGGWLTVWAMPGLLDTPLLDKGPSWRPPDVVEQVITSYLVVLVVAPALCALLGWLTACLFTAPRAGRLTAAAVIAACAALVYPVSDALAGGDGTRFGGVGATDVVFGPAGGSLLTSNGDNTWILWNVTDPARPRRLHTFNDRAVYAPDGRRLASRDGLWSLAGPAGLTRTARFGAGAPVAYDATSSVLASHPTRTTTTFWRVTDPAHPVRFGTIPGAGGGCFSPDGHTFVARSDDATVVWDVRDPARPLRLAILDGGGDGPLSPDGTVVATGTAAGTVLWNVADPAHPRRIGVLADTADPADPGSAARATFSPDSRTAATGRGDGSVELFDTATAARVAILSPTPGGPNNNVQIGASDTLTTVAFSPDGKTLSVITGNATVSVWHIADLRAPVRTRILTRHTDGAGRVAFSPDTTVVAGAAEDGGNSVTLWRLTQQP